MNTATMSGISIAEVSVISRISRSATVGSSSIPRSSARFQRG